MFHRNSDQFLNCSFDWFRFQPHQRVLVDSGIFEDHDHPEKLIFSQSEDGKVKERRHADIRWYTLKFSDFENLGVRSLFLKFSKTKVMPLIYKKF